MTPRFAIYNSTNRYRVKTEHLTKFSLIHFSREVQRSHFYDLLFGVFCLWVLLASLQSFRGFSGPVTIAKLSYFWVVVEPTIFSALYTFWMCFCAVGISARLPVLLYFVGDIVSLCSNPQMIRAYAVCVVAMVQHKKMIFKWPIVNYIGKSRRHPISVLEPKPTVALVRKSSPNPALAKFWSVCGNRSVLINFRPKSLNILFGHEMNNLQNVRMV